MIPANKNEPPIAVNGRAEDTARCVIEQMEIAVGWVQAPKPRNRRIIVVFIQLWIQIGGAVARTVTRKDDPAVRTVTRRHVIIVRWLAGHMRDGIRPIGQAA